MKVMNYNSFMTTYPNRMFPRALSKNRRGAPLLSATRPRQTDDGTADRPEAVVAKKRGAGFVIRRDRRRFEVVQLVSANSTKTANFGKVFTVALKRSVATQKSPLQMEFLAMFSKHKRFEVYTDDEFDPEFPMAIDEIQAQVQDLVAKELSRLLANLAPSIVEGLLVAKARGTSYTRTEWEKPENVPLLEAAGYTGRSDRVINEARRRGEFYALVLEGNSRGYRYPLWQFEADPVRLAKVLEPLNVADTSCWVKHNFLLRPNTLLGGHSPREIILDPHADIEQLVQVTWNRFAGNQGAS